MDYIKKDLNLDVFCRITSHQGDVDKDPNTPKSHASPKSIEKLKRHERHVKVEFLASGNQMNSTMQSS